MAIDLQYDQLIPVTTLAQERLGKRISPATRWRWIHRGVAGGIKLVAVCVSGEWMTTREAFAEFIQAQTDAALQRDHDDENGTRQRSPETLQRLHEAGLMSPDTNA